MNPIDARLQEIARDVFGDDSLILADSTKPADVPGWDSLAHVKFMALLENEFAMEFSDDEFVGFADIGDLRRILTEKLENVRPDIHNCAVTHASPS